MGLLRARRPWVYTLETEVQSLKELPMPIGSTGKGEVSGGEGEGGQVVSE